MGLVLLGALGAGDTATRTRALRSDKARDGRLRNASPELANVFISDGDIEPLAAFLRSVNEDGN